MTQALVHEIVGSVSFTLPCIFTLDIGLGHVTSLGP